MKKQQNTHAEKAKELFKEGYNCSQAVLCAFCDETGLDFETSLKIASSLGGGMGRLREVCGAVSSMFIIAGIKYGYTGKDDDKKKEEHYALIQKLAEEFKNKNNSIICRDLLGLEKEGKDNPKPDRRTKEYYEVRPCEELVGDAAEIMENYIKSKNQEAKK